MNESQNSENLILPSWFLSYLLKNRSNSSRPGYTPISLRPRRRSVEVTQPLLSISKMRKASNILKSAFYIKLILAFSNSRSSEICSLRARTSSSSSASLSTGCLERAGEDSLIWDILSPLKLLSLRGDLLSGVLSLF